MNCHIEWKLGTDSYDVYLFHRMREGTVRSLQHVEGDVWREEEVTASADLKPTFTLRGEWLKVFAKEAAKLPTADDATVAHLADAREVRDRLLRIVEHKMGLSS